MQSERNTFSVELHPSELVHLAHNFGFTPNNINLLDWDMGIGAYNTTIEDRPALNHWLTDLLPQGKSRVVLVSQEDRLFRDRTEIQVNRFIEQVHQHGGWVICGQRVYNFRRELDRLQFRMVCKYGRQYIDFHIKGRLHPAIQRSAMLGRYVGGFLPWGYVVDYQAGSPTYKHFTRYEPHAKLVVDHIFCRFAALPHPSVWQIVRGWWEEERVWPFFTAEIDTRVKRIVDSHCRRDEEKQGILVEPSGGKTDCDRCGLSGLAFQGWRIGAGHK